MIDYVLGFVFDSTCEHVWLIKKNRPAWQAGFLNGIGGKVEQYESLYQAMRRECMEEAGLETSHWIYLGDITFPDAEIAVFYTVVKEDIELESREDEQVVKTPVRFIEPSATNLLPSVPILVSACMARMRRNDFVLTIKHSEPDEKVIDTVQGM